jgi:hypothetical protein
MLRRSWVVSLWGTSLLLAFGCEESKADRCRPGESVACQGENGCEGVKVCDTNGLVFGACECAVDGGGSPGKRPPVVAAACMAGATRSCLGANECTGTARCNVSGTYGPCECSAPPTVVPSTRPNVLGARCRINADCGSSLICWAENEAGPAGAIGGPAQGYCTAACKSSADCSLFQEPGDCLHFSDPSFGVCLASCGAGAPGACQERSELACSTYTALSLTAPSGAAADSGLCTPHCSSDADCLGGGQCNVSQPIASCTGESPDAGAPDAGQ